MNVKMVHIPKCAGITIKTVLSKYSNFYECTNHSYANQNNLKDFFSFAIIRNPWAKLYSGYSFYQVGSEYTKPRFDNLTATSNFNNFVRHIYQNKLYMQNTSKESGEDLIWHKQINWIYKQDGNVIDHLGQFENLIHTFEILENDFNMAGCVNEFKKTHINKTKFKTKYQEMYNSETRDMVAEMYKEDIKLFNYTFDGH